MVILPENGLKCPQKTDQWVKKYGSHCAKRARAILPSAWGARPLCQSSRWPFPAGLDEMRCSVHRDLVDWRRFPRSTLVEHHDTVTPWVEKPPMPRRSTCARSPGQHQNRQAAGISRFLPIHVVDVVDIQPLPIGSISGRRKSLGVAPVLTQIVALMVTENSVGAVGRFQSRSLFIAQSQIQRCNCILDVLSFGGTDDWCRYR